jgi:MFS family permease
VPEEKIGRQASELAFYSILLSMPVQFGVGYAFDMFGRKRILVFCLFSLCFMLALVPRMAPSLFWLRIVRILFGMSQTVIGGNPLVVDYVKKDSRGRASALANFGILLGECVCMMILVQYTKKLDSDLAFFLASLVLITMSLPLLIMIREPDLSAKESNSKFCNSISTVGEEERN